MNDAKRNEKSNVWFIIGDVAVLTATLFLIGVAFATGFFGVTIVELYFLNDAAGVLESEFGANWWVGVVALSVIFKASCNLAGRAALSAAKNAFTPDRVFANAKS